MRFFRVDPYLISSDAALWSGSLRDQLQRVFLCGAKRDKLERRLFGVDPNVMSHNAALWRGT